MPTILFIIVTQLASNYIHKYSYTLNSIAPDTERTQHNWTKQESEEAVNHLMGLRHFHDIDYFMALLDSSFWPNDLADATNASREFGNVSNVIVTQLRHGPVVSFLTHSYFRSIKAWRHYVKAKRNFVTQSSGIDKRKLFQPFFSFEFSDELYDSIRITL